MDNFFFVKMLTDYDSVLILTSNATFCYHEVFDDLHKTNSFITNVQWIVLSRKLILYKCFKFIYWNYVSLWFTYMTNFIVTQVCFKCRSYRFFFNSRNIRSGKEIVITNNKCVNEELLKHSAHTSFRLWVLSTKCTYVEAKAVLWSTLAATFKISFSYIEHDCAWTEHVKQE